MAQLEQLFGRLAQPDEHARYEAAEQIARGRAQLLNPALLPFLRIGLTYDNNYVRSFTLAQLAAGCRDPQVAQHFAANGILVDALRYLADANLELAKNAADLIKSLSASSQGLDLLFSAPSVELLKQQLSNRSEMIRFRALEAVVDVAHASPEGYERVAKAGLLVPLQEGLQARDMLERLSCLPLVEKLCERAWGFEALQREGIFALLVNQAQRAREHEAMVTNNILYLLGRLTRQSPNKELLPLASLWPLLGAALEDNDPTLNEAGITLCGDILSTKPGAEALNAPAQKSVLSMYLEYMSSGNQMLRICAHRSLTLGLSNVANSATLEQVVAAVPLPGATQVNFTYLLMSYTKQPFPDVRSAVLGVMKALAAFDWGVKLLFTFPGYPEWLIDRRTELTKEGKIEKFEVVKAIAQNSFAKTNLVDAEYRKLERFLREGVFYSKSEAQVLVDDKAG